ncbi:putative PTP1-interacting protein, 39 kDa [Trypanosoma rangeli]|uniref:Putative PTP1-interacting protein, 39 kDa n=1 Tax=Trypanosoma rangeli TaxID=5698 RepID=A0A422NQQ5_TRYRA|nr:putative PTP1-interacting protein, 39 kDa [Trypanosoma rangeli]RNF07744.1 putative PTP1-interacting protein, 39 kDa [Trypanosoma rangeli]|eukprot:RNF07744.1 putative PTP1-interacting protein, 39 kDa [Trypanosoma rangeli]
MAVEVLRHDEALRSEEQKRDEGCPERIAQSSDMDFFMDEYMCPDAATKRAAAAHNFVAAEETMNPLGGMAQATRTRKRAQDRLTVDCDVCLQLRGTTGETGGVNFRIRVPAALPRSKLSASSVVYPINDSTTPHVKEMCDIKTKLEVEEATALDSGAAWAGHSESWMRDGVSEEEEGVCVAAADSPRYAVNSNTQHESVITKTMFMPTNDSERLLHAGDFTITVSSEENEGGAGGEGNVVYAMKLPPSFVFGLRLPFEVERALVDWYRENMTSSIPSPAWLSAFLYTTTLRCHTFATSISTLSHSTCREKLEETAAVATLEGFCIVALNIMAQMGQLHRQQLQEADNIDETTAAQCSLLHDNALFSASQQERVRRWLQRYIPMEAYDGNEEGETTLRRAQGGVRWPSAVTIAFYIALDLAKVLFPPLLLNLESTILAALQPLLEARSVGSMLAPSPYVSCSAVSFFAPSLQRPRSRRQAVMLLTQAPSAWWGWWRQKDGEEKSNNGCGISAVSASRGYAALRVLQCFTFIGSQAGLDETCGYVDEEEDSEAAQFLLSSVALFTELLLDREVINTLERATKEITRLYHLSLERPNGKEAAALSLQATQAMMRCFIVLVCWLAFRPGGYCTTFAQQHFGSLLHLAALHHERHPPMHIRRTQLEEGGENLDCTQLLLTLCSQDYFSSLSALFCRLRDRCGARRCRGHYAYATPGNPWRQLRQGKMPSCLFPTDEDRTTSTSYSHYSVTSFSSTNAAPEVVLVPQMSTMQSHTTILGDDAVPSHVLHNLRRAIREIRPVLRQLERDVFAKYEVSAPTSLGIKRQREAEDAVSSPSQRCDGRLQLSVSPQFARHVYNHSHSRFWERHLECSEPSDDDETDTSGSGSE